MVEAVGAEVTRFKVGDRVAYGTGPLGAYSEVHVLPEANLVKLADSVSFEQAAALMLKGLTVQYLLRQTYQVKPGEIILFHAAAGGVGSLACQWAKALGAKLIGTVSSPEKAAHAKALGAWETIDYSHEDVARRVLELTDGKKCPVVYDGVGQDTWLTSLDSVAPRGLVVSFGNASGPVSGVNLGILAQRVRCMSPALRWAATPTTRKTCKRWPMSCSTCWPAANSRSMAFSSTPSRTPPRRRSNSRRGAPLARPS